MFRETASAGGRVGCRRRECRGTAAISKTVAEILKLITVAVKSRVRLALGAGVRLIEAQARPHGASASDKLVEQADALQCGLGNEPCRGVGDRVDHHGSGQCLRATLASMVQGHGLAGVRLLHQRPAEFLLRVLRCGEGPCGRVPGLHQTFPLHRGTADRTGRGPVWTCTHRRTGKKFGDELRSNLHLQNLIAMAQDVAMERHGLAADAAGRLLMKVAAVEAFAGMISRILRGLGYSICPDSGAVATLTMQQKCRRTAASACVGRSANSGNIRFTGRAIEFLREARRVKRIT